MLQHMHFWLLHASTRFVQITKLSSLKKMQCSISVLSALFNFAFQTLHIAIVIHHNTQLEGEECIQKFPGLQSSVA